MNLRSFFRSKGGITTFTGTLLLLVIVVAITSVITTYSMLISLNNSPIQKEVALNVENVRFYEEESNDYVEIVLQNSESEDLIIDKIYAGTSPSNLMTMNRANYQQRTQVTSQGSTLNIKITCSWQEQTKYYFTVVTKSGERLEFSATSTIKES